VVETIEGLPRHDGHPSAGRCAEGNESGRYSDYGINKGIMMGHKTYIPLSRCKSTHDGAIFMRGVLGVEVQGILIGGCLGMCFSIRRIGELVSMSKRREDIRWPSPAGRFEEGC